jgi:hypothetical protein
MTDRVIPAAHPARLAKHAGILLLGIAGAVPILARPASAQLIAVRTVPIAQGDQFDFLPSRNQGMGSVSIAIADTLRDPFSNPAKASRLSGGHFFGTPTFFDVSSNAGGGRTLPLTALARSRSLFGGFGLAFQEIDAARRANFQPPIFLASSVAPPEGSAQPVSEKSHQNRYGFAMVGKAFASAGVSVAASVSGAALEAVDGVDLLYAGSQGISQRGQSMDVRLGFLKEWSPVRSLEAVVVHNRYRSTHAVTYADLFWDPNLRVTVSVPRVENNLDRTNTSGVHLAYVQPLSDAGWRIGGVLTANRLTHPKIPNYEIMNIPRDPGHSEAYNIGVGLSRTRAGTTFGVDAVYEPITTSTWAEAAEPTTTAAGEVIPAGGRTVENRFHFSNAHVRIGISQELDTPAGAPGAGLQLGLGMRSIHYRLRQDNNLALSRRHQVERWVEWSPSWGTSLRFPQLELRYRGRLTTGTGRPGVAMNPGIDFLRSAADASIVAAPSGPLTLDEVRVVAHQLSVSFPLR